MLRRYEKCQKIGVRRGLGQVMTKLLLAHIIPEKIFGPKLSNPVKLDRKRKIWLSVFACFSTAIGKI